MSSLCGKRSFLSDDNSNSPTSPFPKKLRLLSSSSPPSSALDQLRAVFPDMDKQYLERALEESGYDVESAIKNLRNLHLGYAEGITGSVVKPTPDSETGVNTTDEISMKDNLARETVHLEGAEWVELLVSEMQSATSADEVRSRATRVLESLEKSISTCARAEATQSVLKECKMLKEQLEVLVRENTILKRAVTIQHERQKEYDERNLEVQHMKQIIAQYQEHLKNLEINNYALTMHLKQSLENNVMPGSNRDVF